MGRETTQEIICISKGQVPWVTKLTLKMGNWVRYDFMFEAKISVLKQLD